MLLNIVLNFILAYCLQLRPLWMMRAQLTGGVIDCARILYSMNLAVFESIMVINVSKIFYNINRSKYR